MAAETTGEGGEEVFSTGKRYRNVNASNRKRGCLMSQSRY
jgi:hypothetical protein